MSEAQRITAVICFIAAASIVGAAALVTLYLPASEFARSAFRLLCHGREERSFLLHGAAMPLCARCVGIYAGIVLSSIAVALAPLLRRRLDNRLLLVAILPLLIDGGTQAIGLRESNNTLRFATGIVAAFAFLVWAISRMGDQAESAQQKVA